MIGIIIDCKFGAGALLVARAADGALHGLMQRRAETECEPGTWTIFGGMNAPGEWPIAVMYREVREESGIDVAFGRPCEVVHRFDAADEAFSFFTYAVMLSELVEPTLSAESAEARWVPLGDTPETFWAGMPQPLMRGMQHVIDDPEVAAKILAFAAS